LGLVRFLLQVRQGEMVLGGAFIGGRCAIDEGMAGIALAEPPGLPSTP